MKKILFLTLLFLATNVFSQFQYWRIGSTKITDSTGYATFNKSVLFNKNVFVKGIIQFDTLAEGRIYYTGYDMNFFNEKSSGGYTFWMGDKLPKFVINMTTEIFPGYLPLVQIDSTGIDLLADGMQYKINGTPISGSGSTNLYGYAYKDSLNNFLQYNRFKHLTLYGSGADSVGFFVKGTTGDFMVTPVGTGVTFGSTHGTGTKDVFAGEYYRGTTNLTTYYNTNTTFSNIPYLDLANTFTSYNKFTHPDSSIIVKGVKGLTGESFLSLLSPGNGRNAIKIYNSTVSDQIFFVTGNGVGQYTMNNAFMYLGDGSTGRPLITAEAPSTSAVSYSFYNDRNAGLLWNSADNISLVTGGTSRLTVNGTTITSALPFIISGTTSYLDLPDLTTTQRDALTGSLGMMIYNTTTSTYQRWNGSIWEDF